jgi:uncharacterized protein (TIGR03066 family)
MRCVVALAVACVAFELTAAGGSVEGGKLIGVWELTKVEGQDKAPHWRIEFAKDGKLRMVSKKGGEEFKVEGTHALKKDQLTLTVVEGGKAVETKTLKVLTLTDEALVFVDNMKKLEFKRAK